MTEMSWCPPATCCRCTLFERPLSHAALRRICVDCNPMRVSAADPMHTAPHMQSDADTVSHNAAEKHFKQRGALHRAQTGSNEDRVSSIGTPHREAERETRRAGDVGLGRLSALYSGSGMVVTAETHRAAAPILPALAAVSPLNLLSTALISDEGDTSASEDAPGRLATPFNASHFKGSPITERVSFEKSLNAAMLGYGVDAAVTGPF